MQLPTFIFGVTINITMVALVFWIVLLICSGCCLLVLSFPLLLPLLGSFLVVFLFGNTWLSFLIAYII
jgi:hypothetical protein